MFFKFILNFSADYSKGFGGKYGVQKDRQDQSALGFEHQEKLEKHASQKGNRSSAIFFIRLKIEVLLTCSLF